MKTILLFLIIVLSSHSTFSQSDSILKFIFVPHPRSEDRIKQSVLPAIEKIDFSKFDMILLGGDLTWTTSVNLKSMDYCDSLFNLSSQNTLWTLGNHDRSNISLIEKYTGRPNFYAFYRDKITFLVIDTERGAAGFLSSYIHGEQLDMIKNVCDTITTSEFLVILHHRLLWMIGNSDFSERIDSVGESTKQLDTTNFYQDVYPLLLKAKTNGIQIFCLGGDKSRINIDYSPTDSIIFFASTMAPEYADSVNDVLIFSLNKNIGEITYEFVRLDLVEKTEQNPISIKKINVTNEVLKVCQLQSSCEISFELKTGNDQSVNANIYSVTGELQCVLHLRTNEKKTFIVKSKGIYIIKAIAGNSIFTKKIVID